MKKSVFILTFLIMALFATAQTKPTIEWASIPAGTFIMGSPQNEVNRGTNETQRQVTLSAFKMSKYEITVGQFKAFVDATGYKTDAEKGKRKPSGSKILSRELNNFVKERNKFVNKRGVNWNCDENGNPHPATEYNHPVIHVSWNDAKAFAAWMGCRLPTESEWEYACRASSTDPFNTGKNLTTCQANYDGNYPYRNHKKGGYRGKILPVGSFDPNAW
jgi:formylglycine-generating enzyme required for sulfatase activity